MPLAWGRFAAACLAAAALIVAACGGTKNPVAPETVTCAYALSVTTASVPAGGQAITVHVETTASCAWSARTQFGWMALSATSGSGAADIVMTVAPNDTVDERSGAVTIADKDISVRQAGRAPAPCTYALESATPIFDAQGGKGRVAVQTSPGCAWTAQASAGWIMLRVASGTGPGDIEYEVVPYDGTGQRDARIVVDQASFTVRQNPPAATLCTYAVDPASEGLHWHGAVGDGFEIRVTTGASCSWTIAAGAPWIELITADAGTGSTVVRARVGAYTQEVTRSAPLMIRWPTETAGQNVWVSQEGCYYGMSPTVDSVAAAGGRRRVTVFGTPVSTSCTIGCPWDVQTNASWIHIVGATSRTGDDDVSYDVDVNTTGASRVGTLTIAGRTLTVTQGG